MSDEKKTQAASLLAGILEETESEAERERERLEAELKQREEDERKRRADEEAARQAELQRQLSEEARRQDDARARREAAMEALRIEELKEKGLWQEPEPEPAPAPVARAAPAGGPHTAEVVAQQKRSSLPMRLAAAAALVLIGGGVALFLIYGQPELVDTETRYAVAAPATVDVAGAVAAIGFEPIPDPIVREAEPETNQARTPRSTRPSRGTSNSGERRPPRIQLGGELRGP